MEYMTPAFLKRMNTGLDLSGVTDGQIARLLSVAANAVNRVTAAPNHPVPHDFRGGSIELEQHIWDLGNNYRYGSDRLYPYHYPLRSVEQFTLRVTSDQVVRFETADVYSNLNDGYIEIISLARRLSVFSAGFVPVIGLRQPVVELDYTYGRRFRVTGEVMYPTDDGDLRVFAAGNQWWDPEEPVVVSIDGEPVFAVTVDHAEGTVTFPTQVFDGIGITVDYTYRLPADIRDAMALLYVNLSEAARMTGAGLTSVGQIKVEEASVTFPNRKTTVLENFVDDRIEALLAPYRFRSLR